MLSKPHRLAALTAAAIVVCYASTLKGMVLQWWSDEDMGHGFVVPMVIAWIVWRERERWSKLPRSPSAWGVPILLAGAALQLFGALGVGLFVASFGLLLTVLGAVLLLAGFAYVRAWAFPLLLSLFMLPKLAIVYNQATLPLQLAASHLAASMLTTARFAVLREGNILDVNGHRILVAEACNGIRYLLPLGFLATLIAYLRDSRVWTRWALAVASVPVAIVANAVRVAVSGAWPFLVEGTPHAICGAAIFLLCVASLTLVLRLLAQPGAVGHA